MSKQRALVMPDAVWAYIEALRLTGIYGDSESAVMRSLLSRAIEEAINKGVILARGPQ